MKPLAIMLELRRSQHNAESALKAAMEHGTWDRTPNAIKAFVCGALGNVFDAAHWADELRQEYGEKELPHDISQVTQLGRMLKEVGE